MTENAPTVVETVSNVASTGIDVSKAAMLVTATVVVAMITRTVIKLSKMKHQAAYNESKDGMLANDLRDYLDTRKQRYFK